MEKNQEVLNTFMQAWIDEDYETMFEHSQKTWQEGRNVDNLQALFSFLRLRAFSVVSTTTTSSVARKFSTELTFDDGDKVVTVINVICESAPYKTATFGEWGVNPISVLNVIPRPDEPVSESIQKQGETETESVEEKKDTSKIAGTAKKVGRPKKKQ